MDVRESFFRAEELRRERHTLPADLYNLIRLMALRAERGSLFVPIRRMQFQAVLDAEEVIFVDGLRPREILISWCDFEHARAGLDQPVSYQWVYYSTVTPDVMARLPGEFRQALAALARQGVAAAPMPADVVPLARRKGGRGSGKV